MHQFLLGLQHLLHQARGSYLHPPIIPMRKLRAGVRLNLIQLFHVPDLSTEKLVHCYIVTNK